MEREKEQEGKGERKRERKRKGTRKKGKKKVLIIRAKGQNSKQDKGEGQRASLTRRSASRKTPRRLLVFAQSTAALMLDSRRSSMSSGPREVGVGAHAFCIPHLDAKNTGSVSISISSSSFKVFNILDFLKFIKRNQSGGSSQVSSNTIFGIKKGF